MKERVTKVLAVSLVLLLFGAGAAVAYRFFAPRGASAPAPRTTAPPPRTAAAPPLDWNTYHGDNTLKGASDTALPEKLGVLWRFKAGAPVRQTPVVCDGRVFFASARGEVFAVDLSGQRLWSRELFTGEAQNGTPVRERVEAPLACFDHVLLVGTSRGLLYAMDPASGQEQWHAQIEGPILGSPSYLQAIGGARVYVIGRARGELYCLDAGSGRVLWRSQGVERCDGSPAVSEGAIAFGSCAAALHVYSPETGASLRNIEIDPDSQVAGGVALDGDRAFWGCRSGKILQADVKTGQILWTNKDSETEAFATPAITKDWVVESCNDGFIYALDRASGTQRWRFDTKGSPSSAVIMSGTVAATADGELFLLRLNDGAKLCSLKLSDDVTSPAVTRGMLLIGCEDGTVAAVGAAREQQGAAKP